MLDIPAPASLALDEPYLNSEIIITFINHPRLQRRGEICHDVACKRSVRS